jgi:uncharacterized membrane protein
MELAVSYLFLRRAVGLIGSLLPIVVPLGYSITTGNWLLLASISSYYYTDVRNVFVGSLCAVGVFLICYRYRYWDDIFATLAGAFAIGVAFCPPEPSDPSGLAKVTGVLHVVFAALFLITMGLMCLFLFTRSYAPKGQRTSSKNTRNVVYIVCGAVVLAFTGLAGLSALASQSFINEVHPLFWCEAVATFTFGFAWWVKGQTLWKDVSSDAAQTAQPAQPTQPA